MSILGHRIGHLVAIRPIVKENHTKQQVFAVLFKCDCGRYLKVLLHDIRKGTHPERCKVCQPPSRLRSQEVRSTNKSLRKEYPAEYRSWQRAKQKGTLCETWERSFKRFMQYMRGRPAGMALCRETDKRPHSPSNSFWGPKNHKREKLLIFGNDEVTAGWLERNHQVPEQFTRNLRDRKGCLDGQEILRLWKEHIQQLKK